MIVLEPLFFKTFVALNVICQAVSKCKRVCNLTPGVPNTSLVAECLQGVSVKTYF